MADLKNIKPREWVNNPYYELFFQYTDGDKNSGYGFPCTPEGVIVPNEHYSTWKINLEKCRKGEVNVLPGVVVHRNNWHVEEKQGTCKCGEIVILLPEALVNECDHCHRLYTYTGQESLPPSMWTEDIEPEPGVIPGCDW